MRPEQVQQSRPDEEPEGLAGGFKLDIGNPAAFAPTQTRLFILALEGCRPASKLRSFYVLKCVDADDGIQATVNSASDHRHHATRGARETRQSWCRTRILIAVRDP